MLTKFQQQRKVYESTFQLTRRLLQQYLRPYWHILMLGIGCMVVASACTALLAKQMKPIIDDIFIARRADLLWIVAMQVFAIFFVKGIASYGESVTMTFVGERAVATMRQKLVAHLLNADLSFYQRFPSGQLISRVISDATMLHRIVSNTITSMIKDGLTILFLIGVMFYEDWVLASMAFIIFPLSSGPIRWIGRSIRHNSSDIQQGLGSLTVFLTQIIQGARVVKAYGTESHELERGKSLIEKVFHLIMRATKIRAANHPIMEILGGLAIMGVVMYGGYQVIYQHQSSGAFFTFITAFLLAYEPLKHLANMNTELQERLGAATRVLSLLDITPQITSPSKAPPLQFHDGDIEFDDVTFAYEPSQPAIENIALTIPHSKKVALVGPSGGGKSTLMNLIPRFFDVTKGKILINNQKITDVNLASLRAHIALVSQDTVLFDASVRDNICYGTEQPISQNALEKITKAAAAHDFIMQLPQGYDTLIGESGNKLSGGQRQRLAIARAMMKNAPILLLDEATSALDSQSEQQIQQALTTLMQDKTTLMIAHRLSTVMHADIIYVINQGKIIASGSHTTLLQNCALYQQLCYNQLQPGIAKQVVGQ